MTRIQVIQAIPNAIGALCLNTAGEDQLTARPTIIPGLFSIFTSERHQRVLQDKENAVLIGSAVDELIRHHPSLKPAVFEAIKSTLSKIEDLGNTFTPPESTESWYGLVRTSTSTGQTPADDDVLMRTSDPAPIDEAASESTSRPNAPTVSLTDDALDESTTGRSHENIIVSYLDVICRVSRFLILPYSHKPNTRLLSFWKGFFNTLPIARTSFPIRTASCCLADSLRFLAYHMILVAVSHRIHWFRLFVPCLMQHLVRP